MRCFYDRTVVRRLTIEQLASEADASVELIEVLAGVGVLESDPDGLYGVGDLIRLDAAKAFLDANVTVDQMQAALSSGMFTFEFLDRFHPEPGPPSGRTFVEFSESLGVSLAFLGSVYVAMGLARPAPDRKMRRDEEDLLGEFLEAWDIGGDVETYLRAARLIGEPARQVSEGWTRLFVEKVSEPLAASDVAAEERIAAIVESTERLTHLAPPLLLWLFHRHLRNAIDRANIDGMERELVAHGLAVPGPEHPPAIAFVDISGYTGLTETHGDQLATETADRLRQLAEETARAHGGTVVKLLGDGVMLHFETVDKGLAGILQLVNRLDAAGLSAHAGMHAGPVIEHDRDYFGRTVNLASRVAGVAKAGDVLVTQEVKSAVESEAFVFDELPRVTLKGITGSVVLLSARTR
jgi:adenylate cyclase